MNEVLKFISLPCSCSAFKIRKSLKSAGLLYITISSPLLNLGSLKSAEATRFTQQLEIFRAEMCFKKVFLIKFMSRTCFFVIWEHMQLHIIIILVLLNDNESFKTMKIFHAELFITSCFERLPANLCYTSANRWFQIESCFFFPQPQKNCLHQG